MKCKLTLRLKELDSMDEEILTSQEYHEKQVLQALFTQNRVRTYEEYMPNYDDLEDLHNMTIALAKVVILVQETLYNYHLKP